MYGSKIEVEAGMEPYKVYKNMQKKDWQSLIMSSSPGLVSSAVMHCVILDHADDIQKETQSFQEAPAHMFSC